MHLNVGLTKADLSHLYDLDQFSLRLILCVCSRDHNTDVHSERLRSVSFKKTIRQRILCLLGHVSTRMFASADTHTAAYHCVSSH